MLLAEVAAGLVITEAVHKVMSAVVVIHAEKDAAVILGLAAALLVVGAISVLAPVLRAAKIDPIVAGATNDTPSRQHYESALFRWAWPVELMCLPADWSSRRWLFATQSECSRGQQ